MGIDDAIAALGSHPLKNTILQKFAELETSMPNLTGFTSVAPSSLPTYYKANSGVYLGKNFGIPALTKLGLDAKTGAISYLSFDGGVNTWANSKNQLLFLEYQTYSQQDFTDFLLSYNYISYLYEYDDYYDYDKVNIDKGGKECYFCF